MKAVGKSYGPNTLSGRICITYRTKATDGGVAVTKGPISFAHCLIGPPAILQIVAHLEMRDAVLQHVAPLVAGERRHRALGSGMTQSVHWKVAVCRHFGWARAPATQLCRLIYPSPKFAI